MTQSMINSSVARSTGETLRTIRDLGFGLDNGARAALEPEDLRLAVDCPFCGRESHLASDSDGLPAMAECDPCDIYFDYVPSDIYATGTSL